MNESTYRFVIVASYGGKMTWYNVILLIANINFIVF